MTSASGRDRFGIASAVHVTEDILAALAKSASPLDLAALMTDITRELGFRYYALIHHADLRGSPRHRVKLLDYPKSVEERIIGNGTWRRDPVIRACAFTHRAFSWSEIPDIIQLDRRDRDCLEFGGRSGLTEGITRPMPFAWRLYRILHLCWLGDAKMGGAPAGHGADDRHLCLSSGPSIILR
jgi:LuxR family quorum-sensing system transcriptional regulator CciR